MIGLQLSRDICHLHPAVYVVPGNAEDEYNSLKLKMEVNLTFLNCMSKSLSSLCIHNTYRNFEQDVHAIIPFTGESVEGAIFYNRHVTYLRYRPHVLQKRRVLCHLVVPVYLQMKN